MEKSNTLIVNNENENRIKNNTVYLLGDSVMKGVTFFGNPARYRLYPGQRYRELSLHGNEVKNISKMFATIQYAKTTIEDRLNDKLENTSVVLGFGGNDSDYNWDEISHSPKTTHLPHLCENEYEEVYKTCIDHLTENGANVYIANMVPIDPQRYLKRIEEGRNAQNIISWLGDMDMLYRWHEHYNRLTEKIASECNCRLIDLRGAFLTSRSFKDLIGPDGIHPTIEGHDLIEKVITSALLA